MVGCEAQIEKTDTSRRIATEKVIISDASVILGIFLFFFVDRYVIKET